MPFQTPISESFDPTAMSLGHVHHTLLSLVAPRPIAFASTVDKEGRINLSPFSYFNVFGINPPTLVFSPARSVRTLAHKDTTLNVQEVPEVVINLIDRSIIEQASLASCPYPRGVNEFIKSGLEMAPSDLIAPPRVAAAPASFECHVDQIIPLGDGGGSGNLIVCRVLRMHVRQDLLTPEGKVKVDALHMVGRMGGNYYVEAAGAALFEIEKPNEKIGIGVDMLPEPLRTSAYLSGAQLARMGNLAAVPTLEGFKKEDIEPLADAINAKKYPSDAPFWLKGVEILLEKGLAKEAWQWYLLHENG